MLSAKKRSGLLQEATAIMDCSVLCMMLSSPADGEGADACTAMGSHCACQDRLDALTREGQASLHA